MIKKLSIIISTLNEEKYLPKLLTSISRQKFDGEYEVLVIDGKSEDNTVKIAKSFNNKIKNLKVLISRKRNLAAQRNFGEKKATFQTLLFLDADVVLPDNFLCDLQKHFTITEKRFAGSVIHWPDEKHIFSLIIITMMYPFLYLSRFYSPWLPGTCILTSKANHKKIGGFADGAIFGEDIDYGKRSFKTGAKYFLLPHPHITASDRRFKKEGTLSLLWKWLTGYFYVVKYGPVYPNGAFQYEYGHYGETSKS